MNDGDSGDTDSLFRLSARSLDIERGGSEADWGQIVEKLGLGKNKTDFTLAFEENF